jgi:hypothetical protein
MRRANNPWKTAVIASVAVVATAIAIGAGAAMLRKSQSHSDSHAKRAVIVEDCNRYAAAAQRDTGRIVRDGVVGGAVGAGVGAAGGAIADGGDGAGKGAGIGAVLGATVGALRGLSAENQKSEAARSAYADCMARRGY